MVNKDNKEFHISTWGTKIENHLLMESTDTDIAYTMAEHVHQYYELLFNFHPVPLRHTVAGVPHDTNTPFILFRAPYILHSTSSLDKQAYTRTSIGFHPCILTEYGGICKLGRLANCWECVIPTTTECLMELQPLLVRLRRVRDPAVPKSVWLSTLATLLWEVSEIAEDATVADPPSPPYMQELLRYVVEHTEENLTLDMLSEKFFVSRSKLIHDFRTAVRMSLHEYITSICIHRAKILLADGLPLAMIAQQCGFSNDSAFVYMFRRQTGMTPGFYRKSFDRH